MSDSCEHRGMAVSDMTHSAVSAPLKGLTRDGDGIVNAIVGIPPSDGRGQ